MLSKHVTKKLGSKVISDFTQPKFQTKIQCLFIFCTSFFLALIILQPETVKVNVSKSYILVDVVGVFGLVQQVFLCGEVANLILWAFHTNQELQ